MSSVEPNGKPANGFDAWCVLDLFGHQRTAGHVTEATIGGCSFIRIEVPQSDGSFRTEFYGNGAIYSMRPIAEHLARAIAMRSEAPISAWDIQRLGLNAKPETAESNWEKIVNENGLDDDDEQSFLEFITERGCDKSASLEQLQAFHGEWSNKIPY